MTTSKRNAEHYMDTTAYLAIQNASASAKKERPHPTEAEEQETLLEWAAWNTRKYPVLERLFHIPNGGYRIKREAANLKRQGVKAGVPDIQLPVARRGFHGLWIELKAMGGTVSEKQRDWLNFLAEQGHCVFVAHGSDEAIKKIVWYLEDGV